MDGAPDMTFWTGSERAAWQYMNERDAAIERGKMLLEALRKLLDAMTDLEWSANMCGSDYAKDAARKLIEEGLPK